MANSNSFKSEFDGLAEDGCIGDPRGQLAYAYIRVSSDEQAEEGKSGLSRQIRNIDSVAKEKGYKIPWMMVFADDYTGFEFEGRPQLTALRNELKSPERRASVVVIEHLDRLSRNADWHQGFLLEEMKKREVTPVFWKSFGSLVERSVLGAVSQEGMQAQILRMTEGKLFKARSGRVTSRAPAYGYKFVDADGNEGAKAVSETYYAVREDQARIIRRIYQSVLAGDTLRRIAADLESEGFPPPKQYKHWEPTQIRVFIKNEVYKGDFYAHRYQIINKQKPSKDGLSIRKVKASVQRPREEWIHVPVPPIVSREDWDAANRIMLKNQKTAKRNAKMPYLLTGLVRCAQCNWKYAGGTHRNKKTGDVCSRYYRCPNRSIRPKYLVPSDDCKDSVIRVDTLDEIIWGIVSQALLDPKVLLDALDNDATSDQNLQLQSQIGYLESQLNKKKSEDEILWSTLNAKIIDLDEFGQRKEKLKEEVRKLIEQLNRLRSQVLTLEQLEQRKQMVLAMSEEIQAAEMPLDPPFELKQRIIRLIIDEIVLNQTEGWLKVEGAIRGMFSIVNISRAACFYCFASAALRRESGGSRRPARADR